MKLSKIIFPVMLILSIIFSSCDKDEPSSSSSSSTTTTSVKEIKPVISNISSTSTTTDFTVTFRVKSVDFPSVLMKYSSESAKTTSPSLHKSSTPTFFNIVEMKGYSWYYYKTTHTGFRGGNYIYYQISAANEKGSDKSSVGYCIIKR